MMDNKTKRAVFLFFLNLIIIQFLFVRLIDNAKFIWLFFSGCYLLFLYIWLKGKKFPTFTEMLYKYFIVFFSFLVFHNKLKDRVKILDIKDDSIILNTANKELFGIELTGTSSVEKYIDNANIQSIYDSVTNEKKGLIYHVIVKNDKYQKMYIFSYYREVVKVIADILNIKLLKGIELADALLDINLNNEYFIADKKLNKIINIDHTKAIDSNPKEEVVNSILRISVADNIKKAQVYRAYAVKDTSMRAIDYVKLFKIPFKGVIWCNFDFCKVRRNGFAQTFHDSRKMWGQKAGFENFKDIFDRNPSNPILTSSLALLLDSDGSDIIQIGEILGYSYANFQHSRLKPICTMPLQKVDTHFVLPITLDFLNYRIALTHKEQTPKADIYGVDLKGGFINFSFTAENNAPHSVILAETGSGKSFAKQKMLAQMLELDIKTGFCENLGLNSRQYAIRNFDIGGSDFPTYNLIKSNPKNNIERISEDFENFAFNIVNFEINPETEKPYEEDIAFAVDLISMYLEATGVKPLTANEVKVFKNIAFRIYSGDLEIENYRVNSLRLYNRETYIKLKESLGYAEATLLADIKEKEFDFLKKPKLLDFQKHASILAKNQQIENAEREAYFSLEGKLAGLKDSVFNKFDNFSVGDTAYIYADFNTIKESTLFVPLFFAIFWKIFIKDRKRSIKFKSQGKSSPKLIYAIEEASNYFRFQTFVTMFEKLALETRKYNVHLMFILQNLEDVPPAIMNNLPTRIFLTTPERKQDLLYKIKNSLNPTKEFIRAVEVCEQYVMIVQYSKGVFNLRLEYTSDEVALFSSNPNEDKYKKEESESKNEN